MNEKEKRKVKKIAIDNGIMEDDGRSVLIIDHDKIRENYRIFTENLPRVQAYYAVKANSDPAIVKTMYAVGASFDVASYEEFMLVHKMIKRLSKEERQDDSCKYNKAKRDIKKT